MIPYLGNILDLLSINADPERMILLFFRNINNLVFRNIKLKTFTIILKNAHFITEKIFMLKSYLHIQDYFENNAVYSEIIQ